MDSLSYLFNEDGEKMQFYKLAKTMRAQPGAIVEDSGTEGPGDDRV